MRLGLGGRARQCTQAGRLPRVHFHRRQDAHWQLGRLQQEAAGGLGQLARWAEGGGALYLRLPDGRPILFWVLVLVGACKSGTVWAGSCLIHHDHAFILLVLHIKTTKDVT